MKTEQRLGDLLASSITHGVGAVLALADAIYLMVASAGGTPRLVTACAVYAATLILVYLCSTLYHSAGADPGATRPSSPSTIRPFTTRNFTLADLIQTGMMTGEQASVPHSSSERRKEHPHRRRDLNREDHSGECAG